MEMVFLLGLVLTGVLAGIVGSFFGVGGGVIVVPALTILFGFTAQESAAVSLVGITASSSYAASFFISKDLVNLRLGMVLMVATVTGSVVGALFAAQVEEWALLALFSLVMAYSGFYMIRNPERLSAHSVMTGSGRIYSNRTEIDGRMMEYKVDHTASGVAVSGVSGLLSSLIGIGGGSVNVPLMNIWMNVPMKVSTSTSSFMICVTAMSGAVIYYLNGTLLPLVAAAVSLGMVVGSFIGSHSTRYFDGRTLRRQFSVFMFVIAAICLLEAGGIL